MIGKKKIKIKKTITTSYDRLLSYNLKDETDIDEQMLEFADAILSNVPILLNFDNLKDTKKANHVLSFLSGVIYSIGGECYQTGPESYLIASAQAFVDGSLHHWIKEFGYTNNDY